MLEEVTQQEKMILQRIRQALHVARHRYTVKMVIHIYDKGRVIDVELSERERLKVLGA